ncbi:MAG TPA: hypothetical protein VHZ32_00095 [Rhizomicrobium sp.]|jgi:hypothetical protein|nr:hypothetical protein [Rhizomicrobium sp.]
MFDISHVHALSGMLADGLAGLFAAAALLHLLPPAFLSRAYRRWGYARSFLYAAGTVMGATAIFLAVPQLRAWGGILGGMILFVTVTALLNRERYLCALPVILLLAALAPAMA